MPSYYELKKAAIKKFGKCRERPQDVYPDLLNYRLYLNSSTTFSHVIHPYAHEICSWSLTDSMLNHLHCSTSDSVVVDNDAKFTAMLDHLTVQSQVAFDTESNHDDSFYSMICLIQLSSASKNFVVDALKLFTRIKNDLKLVFQSPDILKIVHDFNDVQLLQRDFQIFCQSTINMQDVYHLFKPQPHPISYANMVQHLLDVTLDKAGQHADWRVRPLPKQLVSYAIRDTHYLIRAWDKVKRELLTRAVDLKIVLPSVSLPSLLRLYQFPKRPSAMASFDKVRLNNRRLLLAEKKTSTIVFLKLHDIRLQIAKDLDRPEKRVLSDDVMYDMLAKKWTSFENFADAYTRYPHIQSYLADIYVALDPASVTTGSDEDDGMLEIDVYDAMDLLPPPVSPPPGHSTHRDPPVTDPSPVPSTQATPNLETFPGMDDLSDISDNELPTVEDSDYEIVVEEIEIDSADEAPATPTIPPPRIARRPKRRKQRSTAPQRPLDPLISSIGVGKHSYRRWIRRKHVLARNDIRVGLGIQPVPFRFRHRKPRKPE